LRNRQRDIGFVSPVAELDMAVLFDQKRVERRLVCGSVDQAVQFLFLFRTLLLFSRNRVGDIEHGAIGCNHGSLGSLLASFRRMVRLGLLIFHVDN